MPQKWYYKTMIPIPGFIYKISFLKKWENLHHYLTYFERTLFRILLFDSTYVANFQKTLVCIRDFLNNML